MKTYKTPRVTEHAWPLGLLLALALMPTGSLAQVPNLMTYQGRLQSNGTNVSGPGQFKFALVDAGANNSILIQATAHATITSGRITGVVITNPGTGYTTPPTVTVTDPAGSDAIITATVTSGGVQGLTINRAGTGYINPALAITPPPAPLLFTTFWSNDGSSVAGGEPSTHVVVPIEDGLFTVVLGQNMAGLNPGMFTDAQIHLRVWIGNGNGKFEQLSPDQRLTTAPYAMLSASVTDGAITSAKLAPGAVTVNNLAPNALNALTITNHLQLGNAATHGSLRVFHNNVGTASILLDGEQARFSAYGDGGTERIRLSNLPQQGGDLVLYDEQGNDATVQLTAYDPTAVVSQEGGGSLTLRDNGGNRRAWLWGADAGGQLDLYGVNGHLAALLEARVNGGVLQLRDGAGGSRLEALGEQGQFRLLHPDGNPALELVQIAGGRGLLRTYDSSDNTTVLATVGSAFGGGGYAEFRNVDNGNLRVALHSFQDGGLMRLYDNSNNIRLETLGESGELRLRSGDGDLALTLAQVAGRGLLRTFDPDGSSTVLASIGSAIGGGGFSELRHVSDGNLRAGIHANAGGGRLLLYDSDSHVRLEGLGADGQLRLLQSGGQVSLVLTQYNAGGLLRTYDENGGLTTSLGSDTHGGTGLFYQSDGLPGVQIRGQTGDISSGGQMLLWQAGFPAAVGVVLVGDSAGAGGGGEIAVANSFGTETVEITGQEPGSPGGQILLRRGDNVTTVQIDGQEGTVGGGFVRLYKGDGSTAITLDSQDAQGNGRVITEVLEITGGSDFSEQFTVHQGQGLVEPGMIVSIDPLKTGELVVSNQAYDRTVAGVLSGAGGVRPGMLMRQSGSIADGQHAVALTGRVYCRADASFGAILPGDLLTTSETPGHAMKVTDHARAQGAIIGKAMSPLSTGSGLVLVLVNLH